MALFGNVSNVSGVSGIAPPTGFFQNLKDNPWSAMDQAFNYQNSVNQWTNNQMAQQQNQAQRVPGQLSAAYESSPLLQSFRTTLMNRLNNPGMSQKAVSQIRNRQLSQNAAQGDAAIRRANYSAAGGGIGGAAQANLVAQARARQGLQANRAMADVDVAAEQERLADESRSMSMASQFELSQANMRNQLGGMLMNQLNQWQPHTNADGLSQAAQAAMYAHGLRNSGNGSGSGSGDADSAAGGAAGGFAGGGYGGYSPKPSYGLVTKGRDGKYYAADSHGRPQYDKPTDDPFAMNPNTGMWNSFSGLMGAAGTTRSRNTANYQTYRNPFRISPSAARF